MDFGVFDHLDRGDLPLKDYYEARLTLIEAYDREGFYAYHVAEHHSTPLGMAPSPSVFLAAVAQRTRRLRFGPMVYALPLYHPLRLIEEICMLDQMSGGRLDIGFGRGSSPIELAVYGQDPEEAQRIYAEGLDLILAGVDPEDSGLHRRVLHVRGRAHGAGAAAEAPPSAMVRSSLYGERRAGRPPGPQHRQPGSRRPHAELHRPVPGGVAGGSCGR